MRFIRDMIGRGPQAQGAGPLAVALDPQDDADDEWDAIVEAQMQRAQKADTPVRRAVRRPAAGDDAPRECEMAAAESAPRAAAQPQSAPVSESMKIWELFDDDEPALDPEESLPAGAADARDDSARSQSELAREALAMIQARRGDAPPAVAAPAPAAAATPGGQPAGGGRAKTRLIGFASEGSESDVFQQKHAAPAAGPVMFPVGWIVVVEGPGRGASFPIVAGLSQIGRAATQTVALGFGDQAISRENHASIAYDDESNAFFLGHGGKANIVRLNGRPVLTTEQLSNADLIRIGETTLRFVALCGPDFAWDLTDDEAGA